MAETWTLEVTPGLLERGVAIEDGLGAATRVPREPARDAGAPAHVPLGFRRRAPAARGRRRSGAKASGDEGTRAHVLFHRFQVEWFAGRWGERRPARGRGARARRPARRRAVPRDRALRSSRSSTRTWAMPKATRAGAASGARDRRGAIGCAVRPTEPDRARVPRALARRRRGRRPAPARASRMARRHGWDEADGLRLDKRDRGDHRRRRPRRRRSLARAVRGPRQRSTSPWALATAARGRGLLAAAEGDLDAARAALDRALAEHDRMCCPFERGRTLLALGAVRRRGRAEARRARGARGGVPTSSTGSARGCGRVRRAQSSSASAAGARLGRADRNRAASSPRSRPNGLANKEIAAALHISVHTVEAHLTRIYRKLGIRSRAALAARLPAPERPSAVASVRRLVASSSTPAGIERLDERHDTTPSPRP